MYATPARPRDPEAEAARLTFLARYSPDTQKTYRVALDRFFTWCDEYGIRPLDAERAHLELFSHWLTEDQQLKNSTAYGYLSVISTYFRLAVADRRIDRHNLDRHASYLIASHLSGIAAKLDESASVAA